MTRAQPTIPWHCLTPGCDTRGLTTGTESGTDVKHGREHQHGTTTSTREWEGRK
jgi:hypothetical protein